MHRFRLELTAGEMADVAVVQQGIDLVVRLLGPDEGRLRAVDSPNGATGPEPLPIVAGTAGAHRIEVRSLEAGEAAGRYRVELRALRPATAEDRLRSRAEDALAAAEEARRAGQAADLRRALVLYGRAAELLASTGLSERLGDLLFFQAGTHARLGELEPAADLYRRALERFAAAGDDRRAATALGDLGRTEWQRGEPERALAAYSRALALYRAAGERRGEAAMRVQLGAAYGALSEVERALSSYEEALAIWRHLGAPAEEGTTLLSLGWLYFKLGEHEAALDFYQRALPAVRQAGARRELALALSHIGAARTAAGDSGAIADLDQALDLQRQLGNRREQAVMLHYLGIANLRFGHPEEARGDFHRALELARELGDRWSEAAALLHLGSLEEAQGRASVAVEHFQEALAIARGRGDRAAVAGALFGLARAWRRQGDLARARSAIEEALAGIETLREEPAGQDLRTSFQASRQSYYSFALDLLMDLHQRAPAAGWDRAALEVAERARARGLLDALAEASLGLERGVDAEAEAQEAELERRLVALAEERRLAGAPGNEARAAELEREQRMLAARYHRLEARIRLANPRYASLAAPRPLTVAEIQRQVVGDDTLLLEYALGEGRSYLWAVTRTAVASFVLPGRDTLEEQARLAHRLLAASHLRAARAPADLAAAELGRLLLAPAAALLAPEAPGLAGRRIVVVPDGALHYLPFAALPLPGQPSRPLGEEHEVVSLPSASALALLRSEFGNRAPAPAAVAVFADPVFEAGGPFPRLLFSRQEAATILRLAPAGQTHAALGFDAALPAVLEEDLSRYRVLHFATHGVLDTEQPELSGLVLSQLDPAGRPRDGFVSTSEIVRLDLAADLVTLSACETALGKEVRGEGLVGLTRSFMAAGAERVLVSLWRVDDRATAALMERFYRALWSEGKPAAAALRQAQAELRRMPDWNAPSYWAGFLIQGDWR